MNIKRIRLPKGKTSIIINHIKANYKEYILSLVLLFIGLVIGVILVNNTSDEMKLNIQNYLEEYIADIKSADSIDRGTIFSETIKNTYSFIFIIFISGLLVVGFPVACGALIYKGFCLGYTIATTIKILGTWNGFIFSFTSLFFQNLIYLPCILALTVSSIKICKSIIKDRRRQNIKIEILRHIFFSIFISVICLFGIILETFISSNLVFNLAKLI